MRVKDSSLLLSSSTQERLNIDKYSLKISDHIICPSTSTKNDLSQLTKRKDEKKEISFELNNDAIDQIKNVTQEKKIKPETKLEIKAEHKISIDTFEQLLKICHEKKEIKLKYELEKNINLVGFEKKELKFHLMITLIKTL